jgi:hypothetical protein
LVDAGMTVATRHVGKKSLHELTEDDLCSAVSFLASQINPIKSDLGALNKLSVLSAYWQNNPLMGKNMGKLGEYSSVLQSLSTKNVVSRPGNCQVCGNASVVADANRSWFPLAGSAESDPCSLPNLAGKYICANCFRAVVLLPLGCKFCKGGPYIFHLDDPWLQVDAGKEGFEAVRSQILARGVGNAALKATARLSGRLELLEIVSGSRLDHSQSGVLSKRASHGATIISFSNSGTSASWNQLRLPAQALDFFAALTESQRKDIFLSWAEKSSKTLFDELCNDIEERRSIGPLVAGLLKGRKEEDRKLEQGEKQVLQIYETVALGKGDRFDMLTRIAARINDMESTYRNSFVKQLGNIRSKDSLLQLLRKFAQSEKSELRLTTSELRIIEMSPANEIISLLYLLCVAVE